MGRIYLRKNNIDEGPVNYEPLYAFLRGLSNVNRLGSNPSIQHTISQIRTILQDDAVRVGYGVPAISKLRSDIFMTQGFRLNTSNYRDYDSMEFKGITAYRHNFRNGQNDQCIVCTCGNTSINTTGWSKLVIYLLITSYYPINNKQYSCFMVKLFKNKPSSAEEFINTGIRLNSITDFLAGNNGRSSYQIPYGVELPEEYDITSYSGDYYIGWGFVKPSNLNISNFANGAVITGGFLSK